MDYNIFFILSPVIVAIWAAYSAHKSSLAAAEQTKLVSKQLISDQRAWITFNVRFERDMNQNLDATLFKPIISIKNIGKTPAQNVFTDVEFTAESRSIYNSINIFSEKNRIVELYGSKLVMPGQDYDREWGSHSISQDDERTIMLMIVCVTYKIMHDNDIHQTLNVYNVSYNKKTKILSMEDYWGGFAD